MHITSMKTLYNGTYTLQNKISNEHRTFQIKTQAVDAKFAPGKRVLSLLNGPDNESNYIGFAFITDDNRVIVWFKYRGQNGKKSHYEYYAALFQQLQVIEDENEEITTAINLGDKEYSVLLSKRCFVCNRKLTTPESIKAGIGPICAGRSGL
jgi:hypothetical protein